MPDRQAQYEVDGADVAADFAGFLHWLSREPSSDSVPFTDLEAAVSTHARFAERVYGSLGAVVEPVPVVVPPWTQCELLLGRVA